MSKHLCNILRTKKKSSIAKSVFDLEFETPFGVRNRFDPNCEHFSRFGRRVFSFYEFGPVTPEPHGIYEAVPNKGAAAVSHHLRNRRKARIYLAANIVKSPSSDTEAAAKDYEFCFSQLYDFVDMFFVNVSEESVPGVKQLQEIDLLTEIVDNLLNLRLYFNDYKPILIQVSPDLPKNDLDEIVHYARSSGVDGIVSRDIPQIRYIHLKTDGRLPIVSKVAFHNVREAAALLDSGAALVCTPAQSFGFANTPVFLHRFKKTFKSRQ